MRSGDYDVEGTLRSERVSLQLGFAAEEFSYLIDLGLPIRSESAFNLDPEIKRELVWSGPVQRPATMLVRRKGPLVQLRDGRGWVPVHTELRTYESALTVCSGPSVPPNCRTAHCATCCWSRPCSAPGRRA
jgi:predicted ATPase